VAKPLTITKHGDDTIEVKFSDGLPALSKLPKGAEIPTEYLHTILNYHVTHQDEKGEISSAHVKRMKAYW